MFRPTQRTLGWGLLKFSRAAPTSTRPPFHRPSNAFDHSSNPDNGAPSVALSCSVRRRCVREMHSGKGAVPQRRVSGEELSSPPPPKQSSEKNKDGASRGDDGRDPRATTTAAAVENPRRRQSQKSKSDSSAFTPSPFERSPYVSCGDGFVIQRILTDEMEPYGMRRYLLLPSDGLRDPRSSAVATLHANRNVLFGAQLPVSISSDHATTATKGDLLKACGPLVDVAKEDASVNGQQPQALATLSGLCAWVSACLERDGEGSDVLRGLLHGSIEGVEERELEMSLETEAGKEKLRNEVIDRESLIVTNRSAGLIFENEEERIVFLEAVRAIATGNPRPGHTVVGAGTYRDGKDAWMSLAWEYAQSTSTNTFVSSSSSSSSSVESFDIRSEEVALYQSRGGEVTTVEHLAHVEPEYLRVAGGAMVRMFFI